jgi:ribosomal protein S1
MPGFPKNSKATINMTNLKNTAKVASSMSNTIKNDPNLKFFKEADLVKGKIIKKEGTKIYIDLGIYGTGIIFGKEFYDASSLLKDIKPGDEITAKVVMVENEEGYTELSLKEADQNLFWEGLREKMTNKEIVKVKISETNKGGLIAHLNGVPAFLPVSQLSMEKYPRVEGGDKTKILQELEKHIGQEFDVRVIDIDPKERKIILSEKEAKTEHTSKILQNCKVGDIVEGKITGIADFGAFIKFGVGEKDVHQELEGLIHISELSWELIENPHDFIKVGENVTAKIISIDNGRVALSLKALKDNPWSKAEEQYKKGSVVEGIVFKFNPYGAFVKFPDGIHGLCHVSDFESVEKMKEKLQTGKSYKFKVSSVSAEGHKLGLTFVNEEVKEEKKEEKAEKKEKKEKAEKKPKKEKAEKAEVKKEE